MVFDYRMYPFELVGQIVVNARLIGMVGADVAAIVGE